MIGAVAAAHDDLVVLITNTSEAIVISDTLVLGWIKKPPAAGWATRGQGLDLCSFARFLAHG